MNNEQVSTITRTVLSIWINIVGGSGCFVSAQALQSSHTILPCKRCSLNSVNCPSHTYQIWDILWQLYPENTERERQVVHIWIFISIIVRASHCLAFDFSSWSYGGIGTTRHSVTVIYHTIQTDFCFRRVRPENISLHCLAETRTLLSVLYHWRITSSLSFFVALGMGTLRLFLFVRLRTSLNECLETLKYLATGQTNIKNIGNHSKNGPDRRIQANIQPNQPKHKPKQQIKRSKLFITRPLLTLQKCRPIF